MLRVLAIDNCLDIDVLDVEKGRSGEAIEEFWTSGILVKEIDWVNGMYKNHTSVYSSFRRMIKKMKFNDCKVTMRGDRVFIVNLYFT